MIVTTPERAVPIATDFPSRRSSALHARGVGHDDVVGHGLDDVVQSAMLPMGDGAIGRV